MTSEDIKHQLIHTFFADLVSPLQFIDRGGHIGDGLDQSAKCLSAPHYRLKFGPCVFVMVYDFLRPQFYKYYVTVRGRVGDLSRVRHYVSLYARHAYRVILLKLNWTQEGAAFPTK